MAIKTGSHKPSSKRISEQEDTLKGVSRKRARVADKSDSGSLPENGNGDVTENEGDGDEEENAGTQKKCLAITCQNGRIGCAYFDPIKMVIRVLEDMLESLHWDMTTMLIEQVKPIVVLTSSKADDRFIEILRKSMDDSDGSFQIRPHKDFTPRRGLDRLLSLSLLSELPVSSAELLDARERGGSVPATNVYDFMRKRIDINGDPTMKRWNASIRMANFAAFDQSPLCLSSIGALLDHLTRERAIGDLEHEGVDGLDIQGIEVFSVDQVMHINADALLSLQVFEQEGHASIHSDKSKEGLSLYGILNNTKTVLGRNLLRQWLLRPALSISVINSRHDAVACFLHPDNISTADLLHQYLAKIKNVPRILCAMKSGKSKVNDWQGLLVFSFHAALIQDSLNELHQSTTIEIVRKLITVLDVGMFREVGTAINDTIDWEESETSGRVSVRQHIDEELDNRKHIYAGIDTVLSKVAEQISVTMPENISSLNVVYFPQLGFLICLPMLEEWKDGSAIEVMDGWTYQFSSERVTPKYHLFNSNSLRRAHVYFKSVEMHDMDTHIGDLHSSIVDRELEIIQALQDKVMVYKEAMSITCDLCAELDCLLCFAESSRSYNFVRPEMSEHNIIRIVQGRHPLQELVVDTFVPNDANLVGGRRETVSASDDQSELGYDEKNIVICTGANACGKSVYLKQVALIQYMAQIGCFIPAESATLGIVDKIFTRVQTRESVSKAQSAFMIDLNQVSLALRNCTERSLILLDEFGKGTMSTDGAGLFCGVIKHLLNRGRACPKVLVATHFHQVNTEMLSSADLSISFVHMQVMFTTNAGQAIGTSDDNTVVTGTRPGDKITYLYRVAKGLARHSHAAKCAELCGLSQTFVQRAQHVSNLYAAHELGRLLDEEMNEDEKKDLENTEAICRRFLAWNLEDSQDGVDKKKKLADVLGRIV